MTDESAMKEALFAIHNAIEQAGYALSTLGEHLQFLVGPEGDIEIVRRSKTGETARPKVVIAKLDGCDPLLWRPEHPRWMQSLDPQAPEVEAPVEEAGEATPPAEEDGAAESAPVDPPSTEGP